MTRIRHLAATLFAAALVLGLGSGGAAVQAQAKPVKPRPNILVLETDDQTLEQLRVMANVKRLLGDEGVTFDNSFVGYSLCCPSRATLLTGQYAHNHGVMGNSPPNGGYAKLDHSNTLAVWLQAAGYTTIHLGKFLNGYGKTDSTPTEIPPGWTEWRASVDPSTYSFYGFTLNENGKLTTYPRDYQTDLYARKASEIVRRRAAEAAPFFLWVAFLAPHSGAPRDPDDPRRVSSPSPAPRHRDDFASEQLPMPPSFNELDVSDKPEGIRNRPLLGPAQIAAVREMYQQRLESLLAVDEAVARIVAALRSTGELGNTLIVFTSDNGFFHGEHRVPQSKVLVYEPSIRVPLIMRGPGIPRGVHLSQLVSNIDLAPTMVDVAGARPRRTLDGRSLLALFRNPRVEWSRDLLVERGATRKREDGGVFTAIRTQQFKYVEYVNGEQELYDLAQDPHELRSRHGEPAYAAVQAELARRLAVLRTCAGSTCR